MQVSSGEVGGGSGGRGGGWGDKGFLPSQLASQPLTYSFVLGMVSVLELMQGGFPSRAQFSELYHM